MFPSIVKSIDVRADYDKAFDYAADPMNLPKWANHHFHSVSKGEDGWYDVDAKFGQESVHPKGHIKFYPERQNGTIDHEFKDLFESATTRTRIVRNGDDGVTFVFIFFRPPHITDEMSDAFSKFMDIHLRQLKEILEK